MLRCAVWPSCALSNCACLIHGCRAAAKVGGGSRAPRAIAASCGLPAALCCCWACCCWAMAAALACCCRGVLAFMSLGGPARQVARRAQGELAAAGPAVFDVATSSTRTARWQCAPKPTTYNIRGRSFCTDHAQCRRKRISAGSDVLCTRSCAAFFTSTSSQVRNYLRTRRHAMVQRSLAPLPVCADLGQQSRGLGGGMPAPCRAHAHAVMQAACR